EDPGNFGLFGLRVNRSNAPLALEHTFAYSPRFIETESSALIYNTNLLLQTPVSGIQPFATAGIGVVSTWGGGPGDIGSKFQVNYGGGIKLRIFGLAGLRVDVRGYSIRDVYEESLHVFESSVGLLFAF